MADININANGCSNSKNFPKTQTSISWHSSKDCTVDFIPSTGNCFGVASITFPPSDQTLQCTAIDTQFVTPCVTEDTYDITFISPEKKPRVAKKAVKAAKKRAPAKKAAKAKKTAKATKAKPAKKSKKARKR